MLFRRNNRAPAREEVDCRRLRESGLFDAGWYLREYPDVAGVGFDPALHYLRHGADEMRDPGPWFSTARYAASVGASLRGRNPLLHYLEHGAEFIGRRQEPASGLQYRNLREYLIHTLLQPVVRAPFSEEDKRCFAGMASIGKYLARFAQDAAEKVSVIMPVWNRRDTISSAIESVMAQTYRGFELIIIDDGSSDGTVEIADRACVDDERLRLVKLEHGGVAAARNRGLEAASGDIIAYLDSDNLWLPDYLACTVGAFRLLPHAQAVYSAQYLHESPEIVAPTAVRFAAMNFSMLENHNYIDLNCFAHRRVVAETGLRFSEELERLVDWDFILRVSEAHQMFSIPFLQARYFLNGAENSITRNVALEPARGRIITACANRAGVRLQISPPVSRRVSIIVPSYQALKHLIVCVQSLRTYLENPLIDLIIVDNASDWSLQEYLRGLAGSRIQVINNDVNYGFSYAVNQGVAASDPNSDVLLLNNDAWLHPGAIEALQAAAHAASDVAISVPRQIVPPGLPDTIRHVPYAWEAAQCDVTLSAHHGNIEQIDVFHDGQLVELNFAPFFCAYIKRDAWNACGGLDHANGRHYRSDRIMCDFVRNVLGKRIVYTPFAHVFHSVQASTGSLSRDGEGGQANEHETMLLANAWPDDLARRIGIRREPWDT